MRRKFPTRARSSKIATKLETSWFLQRGAYPPPSKPALTRKQTDHHINVSDRRPCLQSKHVESSDPSAGPLYARAWRGPSDDTARGGTARGTAESRYRAGASR